MLASELVNQLSEMIVLYGDFDVKLDVGPDGLMKIDEVDFLFDEAAFILWGAEQ